MKKCTERCIFFCFSREFFYIMLYRPLVAEAILDDGSWLPPAAASVCIA